MMRSRVVARSILRSHVVIFALVLLVHTSPAQDPRGSAKSKTDEVMKLRDQITGIVLGNVSDSLISEVDPSALLVDERGIHEDLRDVLWSSRANRSFPSLPGGKVKFLSGRFAGDGSAGFFTLTATDGNGDMPRHHSIFFMADSGKPLRITHWHTSK